MSKSKPKSHIKIVQVTPLKLIHLLIMRVPQIKLIEVDPNVVRFLSWYSRLRTIVWIIYSFWIKFKHILTSLLLLQLIHIQQIKYPIHTCAKWLFKTNTSNTRLIFRVLIISCICVDFGSVSIVGVRNLKNRIN